MNPLLISLALAGALLIGLPEALIRDRGPSLIGQAIDRLKPNLAQRIETAGLGLAPGDFRSRQVATAFAAGFGLMFGVLGVGRPVGVATASGLLGAAGAICAFEIWLDRNARARSERIARQVPAFADLVCLGVIAGESLRTALLSAARECGGPLAEELSRLRDEIANGATLSDSLSGLAVRVDTPPLHRLVASLTIAHEKGAPLAEQLQTLSSELRAAERRLLIEAAAKHQTRMLIPVVALILPTALAFAFFPGVMAIQNFMGG